MKCDSGFIAASSTNLPMVDDEMVMSWILNNSDRIRAENRGTKDARSSQPSYGDNAIAWVQVMRIDGDICHVKAKMTPEHNIKKTPYPLEVKIQERILDKDPEIISAICTGCAASADECKHQLSLVMWLNRRSMEPSVTEVKCYWKASNLSKVGRGIDSMLSTEVGPVKKGKFENALDFPDVPAEEAENFYLEVAQNIVSLNLNCQIAKYLKPLTPIELLSIHNLTYDFHEQSGSTPIDFFHFCEGKMTDELCKEIELLTRDQSNCPIWSKLRFGRITASKLHEASKCSTLDGSLVESILGAKIKDSKAMKRGRRLEKDVKEVAEKLTEMKFDVCGLLLKKELSIFGASPDGINKTHILEIKCPESEKTMKNYINENDEICPNRLAQIQAQMYFANKKYAVFCVASPKFETDKNVYIYHLRYDNRIFFEYIEAAKKFWIEAVFPKLKRTPL